MGFLHPYYVSVTEIEYNAAKKEMGIACKIFTDDFETAMKQLYGQGLDILNTKDPVILKKQMAGYIASHLNIATDGRQQVLSFLGFEIEGEATWCYFDVKEVKPFRELKVFNNLLYESKKEQVNFVHLRIDGQKKTFRLIYPRSDLVYP